MAKKYTLPNMDFKFQIQCTGEESGINWVGDFLYRRPTLAERSSIETTRIRLNGDLRTIDADVAALNEALSYLRWTLKESPDWWRESDFGGSLFDANVVIAVYNKVSEFEAEWRIKTFGGKPETVEENATAQAAQ